MQTRLSPMPFAGLLTWVFFTGCSGQHQHLNQALYADRNPAAHAQDLESHYCVRCPDVLLIQIAGRPDLTDREPIGIDGRIDINGFGSLDVNGRTTFEIAQEVAKRLRLRPKDVKVKVVEYNSQHLYVLGEVDSRHQVVPFRGPETILDLLQRLGIEPGASLTDIRLVRAHVADGNPPEVFHIDLRAILLKKDLQTNIRVQPFDRIYIAQNLHEQMTCNLPPWLRHLCQSPDDKHQSAVATPR